MSSISEQFKRNIETCKAGLESCLRLTPLLQIFEFGEEKCTKQLKLILYVFGILLHVLIGF